MTSNRFATGLCLGAALAAASLFPMSMQAQDLPTKGYWLGVACAPVTEDLRDELKLELAEGVIVVDIIPQSPAAKAGLEKHDVLVIAGDKPLAEVQDLIGVVNDAQGKSFKLAYVRDGERHEVEITPAPRGDDKAYAVPLPSKAPFNVQIMRPGHMVPARVALKLRPRELPDDMSVTVKKHGKEPAQISVEQGDKSWQVSEDKLDDLPAEVRRHVEPMLGRVVMQLPDAAGDVLTYMPNVEELHAQAREAARKAHREAEEAARQAGREAEEAARKATRDVEEQTRDLKRQAVEKTREARGLAEKYVREKGESAIEQSRKWVDRHLDERFDDVNRRLDELRKMIDVLRGDRAVPAPAPAAEPVAPGKADAPAEKPDQL